MGSGGGYSPAVPDRPGEKEKGDSSPSAPGKGRARITLRIRENRRRIRRCQLSHIRSCLLGLGQLLFSKGRGGSVRT